MSLFNFNPEEMLSFFAVLVRVSVLFSVLPFLGDRSVPGPVKILLSLCVSIVIFPALVAGGRIRPSAAAIWGDSAGGIAAVIGFETIFGLILGFVGRLVFEAISFAGNLCGTFMGFAAATVYDPQQESHTQVVAQFHTAMAMLLFLILDGHHLMLRASLESYQVVGLGGNGTSGSLGLNGTFSQRLIDITGQVIKIGSQIAAPVAVSLFAVNVAFGVMSKAMPQLNILVLSLGASTLIGLAVILLGLPEFQAALSDVLPKAGEWMRAMSMAMVGK